MVPMDAPIIAKGRGPNAFYRVLCGWGHPCTGALGELRQPFGGSAIHMYYRNISRATARPWELTHARLFRRHGDGYKLIKETVVRRHGDTMQRRRGLGGSRPTPEALRTGKVQEWDMIGERPELPALVYCPRCGRPNRVAVPVTSEAPERVV